MGWGRCMRCEVGEVYKMWGGEVYEMWGGEVYEM